MKNQDALFGPPMKERKPRQKSKKGKGREEDTPTTFAASAAKGNSGVAQDQSPRTDDVTWSWASLTDISISSQPPVFTNDCRCVRSLVLASAC